MKEFNLSASVTISVYTTVEAETLEQAIAIAKNRDVKPYQWGSKDQEKENWISDEFDGEPLNIIES